MVSMGHVKLSKQERNEKLELHFWDMWTNSVIYAVKKGNYVLYIQSIYIFNVYFLACNSKGTINKRTG